MTAALGIVSDEYDDDGDLRGTPTNQRRAAKLRAALQELIHTGCSKGMTATLTLRFTVQNGTIQLVEDEVNRRHKLD